MSFTADAVLEYYRSQYGIKGGAKYFADFGMSDLGDWCCIGACEALKNAGRDIGGWINCGTKAAEGGIQAGFRKAGFTKVDSLKDACRGSFFIMNWHNDDVYIYDHCCCWYGEYDADGKVKTANFNVGGTNGIRYYDVSDIQAIWVPDYDGLNGWKLESGKWHFYHMGNKVVKSWKMGEGKFSGKWYWLDENGNVAKNRIVKANGKTYYVGNDGAAIVNTVKKYKGKYYYFGEDGALHTEGTVNVKFKCNKDGSLSLEQWQVV